MALPKLHSMRDFLRIWFFWKTQAVLIFIIIVGLVSFYAYTCIPRYESHAKILLLPRTSEGSVISADSGDYERRIAILTAKDVNTEIALLRSNDVIKKTVIHFNSHMELKSTDRIWYYDIIVFLKKMVFRMATITRLAEPYKSSVESNIELIQNSLTIKPAEEDSNVIYVTLTAEKPRQAAIVLNKLLEIYIEHHNNVFNKKDGLLFYRDQTVDYRKKLLEVENKLKEFHKKNDIIDLAMQNETIMVLLRNLNETLENIEITYDESKARISILRSELDKNKNDVLVTKEMRNIPVIVGLEESIVPLLIRRSEIQKTYTMSSREHNDINAQIDMLRGEIKKEVYKALRTDELELESLKIKKQSLVKRISNIKEKLAILNQREKTQIELQRQIEIYKNNYILYASKTEDASIFSERANRDLANVSIADSASIPNQRVFPNRMRLLFLSILAGIFSALSFPFILESLDQRLKTASDVEEFLNLPVICNIMEVKSN